MPKYLNMYGYGIRSDTFSYKPRVLTRGKKDFKLLDPINIHSSTNYVKFLTEKDAQKFIDDYLDKTPPFDKYDYKIYKARKQKNHILFDDKYNLYLTIPEVDNRLVFTSLDKNNNVISQESSFDDMTISDLCTYLNQLFETDPQVFAYLWDSKTDSALNDYINYLSSSSERKAKLSLPDSIHLTFYFIKHKISQIDESHINIQGTFGIDCNIENYMANSPDWSEFLNTGHYGSDVQFGVVGTGRFHDKLINITIDLQDFKSYISNISKYRSFQELLLKYFTNKLKLLPLENNCDPKLKKILNDFKDKLNKTLDFLDQEFDNFTSTDIIESYIPDNLLDEANLRYMSWRIKDIKWIYKEGIECTIIAPYKKLLFTLDYLDDTHPNFPKTFIFSIYTTDARFVNELTKKEYEIFNKCVSLLIDIGFHKNGNNRFILERNSPLDITYPHDIHEFSEICDDLVEALNEVVPV